MANTTDIKLSHDELATHCYGCNRRGRDTAEQPLPDDWIKVYHAAHDDGPTAPRPARCGPALRR